MDAIEVAAWPGDDEDAALVRRAKERDSAVWAAWYDQYYGLIYRYAFSRLSNRDDAADLAAHVFLEALKSIDRYRYQGRPVLAWFYGIARNLVYQRLKQARRQRTLELADEEAVDTAEGTIDNLALREAVAKLTADQREVLTLTFLLSLSVRETAGVLGKKEATIYSLQARAVANLRRLMAA